MINSLNLKNKISGELNCIMYYSLISSIFIHRLHYHTEQSVTSQPMKLLSKKEPIPQVTENKTTT